MSVCKPNSSVDKYVNLKRSHKSPDKRDVLRKKKKKEHSSESEDSDDSSSTSSSSSASSIASSTYSDRGRKKSKKRKKKLKKEKKLKKKLKLKKKKLKKKLKEKIKKDKSEAKGEEEESIVGPIPLPGQQEIPDRSKRMAPMTKEEWEKKQSVVRRVYDEATGRHRLIKGDGEVLEEIVSKQRHQEINRQATQGDGTSFQNELASKLGQKINNKSFS